MVAVIRVGSSIRRTFHYNENKVNEGCAELIMAGNYPLDLSKMNTEQRLNMLLRTAESNPNVKANSVHISLNFAPDEQLDNGKLTAIATEYMEAIGFGDQPYLVYRHDDAAHPHIHIATVKVDQDGKRIETQNIGKNLSEPVRKALETKYGLVCAEDHRKQLFSLKPVDAGKVQYGKTETKRAIGNVLEYVLNSYKYTSLPELNAVLNLYNVSAERGSEGSRTFRNRGLVYWMLASDGQPVGVPIKASLFHNKPTLDFLEKQFIRNDVVRQPHRSKVRSTIDFALKSKQPKTFDNLSEALKNSGIRMVIRRNGEGLVYGITYVDFKSRCVFNGSALGKNYSAKGMLERLQSANNPQRRLSIEKPVRIIRNATVDPGNTTTGTSSIATTKHDRSLLEELMQFEYAAQQVPFEWRKKKKRKRKKW